MFDLSGKSLGEEKIDFRSAISDQEKLDPNNVRIRYGGTCPNGDLLLCDLGNDIVFRRSLDGTVKQMTGHPMFDLKKVCDKKA